MTNRIVPPPPRPPGVKMTIDVYTVTRDGRVTPPRATVVVPHDYEPAGNLWGLDQLEPCACPMHRPTGSR
ncbi:hypothetical protein [Streptomyces sp. NPDC088789]|uniref:hypothetical protein n=1 Tax=Streptomyces sp. NPDC088789 TaxID=3365899 RepID=UPI00382002F0